MTMGLIAATLVGAAAGLGVFTFAYAKGGSYLTNDPKACANCHVMNDQYAGWLKSSHRAVAVCNDCHTPHTFFGKYATKARNGFWHSLHFTSGTFPEPIRITPGSMAIAEGTCRDCHADVAHGIDGPRTDHEPVGGCTRCHSGVGHMN